MATRSLNIVLSRSCSCSVGQSCQECGHKDFPCCNSCDGVVLIPHDPAKLISPNRYILGTLTAGPLFSPNQIVYTVQFDDGLLIAPNGVLTQGDFKICCYDCSARIGELASIWRELDTNSVNLTYLGRVLSADVRISGVGGNQVSINSDGLFVPPVIIPPQTPLIANDSNTIDFSTSGVDQHTLTGVVRVSGAAGNTVISNADGIFVPTVVIPPPLNSDSLVDNGNRTFTHTAANGAVQNFCQGFDSLDQGAGCETVGANNMVRSVNLNGCTLRITSAPEHTSARANVAAAGFNPNPINASGQVRTTAIATTTLTNPSNCRSMIGILVARGRMFGFLGVGDLARLEFRLRVDPGTAVFTSLGKRRSFQQAGGPSNYTYDMDLAYQTTFIIPPGGSLTFRSVAEVEALSLNIGGVYTFDGAPEGMVVDIEAVGHTS